MVVSRKDDVSRPELSEASEDLTPPVPASRFNVEPEHVVGRLLGDRFRISEPLARGGMSVVYKAEQLPLGREVAIKLLYVRADRDSAEMKFDARFFLEAKAAASLHHPNTIVIHDYGRTDDGLYYIAMEYLHGQTLYRAIRDDGPVDPLHALHVGLQVCGSLGEAHEHGLIHRDLKPSNVFLTHRGADDLFVKVLDFGLVKALGSDSIQTKSGVLMGSPHYMSPEQVRGEPVDVRSDVYSFGALLYHAITGMPLFAGRSGYEVMRAQLDQKPSSFREVYSNCTASEDLEATIMCCLNKDPELRFQSMADVAAALRECAAPYANARSIGGDSALDTLRPSSYPRRSPVSGVRDVTDSRQPARVSSSLNRAQRSHSTGSVPFRPGMASTALLVLIGAALAVGASALWVRFQEAPPTSDPAPEVKQETPEPILWSEKVRVMSIPLGAQVRHGPLDLGDTPLTLVLPVGERWQLELRKEGHRRRTVTVTSGQGEITIRLQPLSEPPGGTPPGGTPPSRTEGDHETSELRTR